MTSRRDRSGDTAGLMGQGISPRDYGGFDQPVEEPQAGVETPHRARSARGNHVGKGPKGYTRSDERIREEVCERLLFHPDIDARDISVEVQACEVTLTGTVEDRQIKLLTEHVVDGVAGVEEIHNRLRVVPYQPSARGDEADARDRLPAADAARSPDRLTTQDS